MLVEANFVNGHKERVLCARSTTLKQFVEEVEARSGSKVKTLRIVKRDVHVDGRENARDPHR